VVLSHFWAAHQSLVLPRDTDMISPTCQAEKWRPRGYINVMWPYNGKIKPKI
jgi:hypothetical protein